jgi:hypothetical protein
VSRQRTGGFDAAAAGAVLGRTERRVLHLLGQLPLIPAPLLACVLGGRGPATSYRALGRLRAEGVVGSAPVPVRRGRPRALWHLTSAGIEMLALDEAKPPKDLARERRLRASDLRRMLVGWPPLLACYEILAALARSHLDEPELVEWRRPWILRSETYAPARGSRLSFPAYAALHWKDARLGVEAVLIPDLGSEPLAAHARAMARLASSRSTSDRPLPAIVVAAPEGRRLNAWRIAVEEIARVRATTSVRLVSWRDVHGGAEIVSPQQRWLEELRSAELPRPAAQLECRKRSMAVGSNYPPRRARPSSAPKQFSPSDRAMLEVIGRHPFLPLTALAEYLGWPPAQARARCRALAACSMVRVLGPDEAGVHAARDLVELTAVGLVRLLRWAGLSISTAVRQLGLAGGGREQPVGNRRLLMRDLAHTLGADAIFVGLTVLARRRAAALGTDDALLDWRGAAACARGHVHPDGYGLFQSGGQLHGFFLEYDRGTMQARDYRRKFGAYYRYRDTGRFRRDYDGFPTILLVTAGTGSEERIARVLRAAETGQAAPPLPVLLTSVGWIESQAHGLLGPIWREPGSTQRRRWPVDRGTVGWRAAEGFSAASIQRPTSFL